LSDISADFILITSPGKLIKRIVFALGPANLPLQPKTMPRKTAPIVSNRRAFWRKCLEFDLDDFFGLATILKWIWRDGDKEFVDSKILNSKN
jgi:hypothetical protein